MGEIVHDLNTAGVSEDASRQKCSACGKRRVCRKFMWSDGITASYCAEDEQALRKAQAMRDSQAEQVQPEIKRRKSLSEVLAANRARIGKYKRKRHPRWLNWLPQGIRTRISKYERERVAIPKAASPRKEVREYDRKHRTKDMRPKMVGYGRSWWK